MAYVVAGYTVVLGILFLYAVQLVWRRRRLVREVGVLETGPPVAAPSASSGPSASGGPGGPETGPAELR